MKQPDLAIINLSAVAKNKAQEILSESAKSSQSLNSVHSNAGLVNSNDNLNNSNKNLKISSINLTAKSSSNLTKSNTLKSKSTLKRPTTMNKGDKSALQSIRDQRLEAHRQAADSAGPRLLASSLVDVSTIQQGARLKAKEMAQRVRNDLLSEKRGKKDKPKKKEKDAKPVKSELILPSIDPRSLGHRLDKQIINSNFDLLLGLNEDAILNGDTYNPEQLLKLMPVRPLPKTRYNQHSEITDNNFILNYTNVNIAGKSSTLIELNELLPNIITEEMKVARQQKHENFLSLVKMPGHLSDISLNKEDSVSSLQENIGGIKSAFWTDFEILLERQFAIEQEALSNLSAIDNNQNSGSMARFGRDDIASLLCNVLNYLQTSDEKRFRNSLCMEIYEVLQSGEYDNGNALSIKNILAGLEKSEFLELKTIISHLRRVILSSTENQVEMQELIRRTSNLVSNLLFETNIHLGEDDIGMERVGNGTRNSVNVGTVEFEKDKSSSPTRQGHRRGSDDQKGRQKGGTSMRGRSFADRQRAGLFEPTPSSRKFTSVAPPKKDAKILIDVFADGEAEKSTKQEEPMSIAKQRWIMAFQKIVDKLPPVPKKKRTSFKIVKNFVSPLISNVFDISSPMDIHPEVPISTSPRTSVHTNQDQDVEASQDLNQLWVVENVRLPLYEIQSALSWHAKATEIFIKYAELIFNQ